MEHSTTEAALRSRAQRQGLQLMKSRSRTPEHYDYGTYMLVDPDTNSIVAYGLSNGYGMSLEEIATALDE